MSIILEVDGTTGDVTERPLTDEEAAALEAAQAEAQATADALAQAQADADAARERALGKLRALGLTDADLAALGIR